MNMLMKVLRGIAHFFEDGWKAIICSAGQIAKQRSQNVAARERVAQVMEVQVRVSRRDPQRLKRL